MSITGVVKDNSIRLPEGIQLEDGTAVRIELIGVPSTGSFGERYADFVGAVKDAPTDLAAEHDRYLYGSRNSNP